MQFGRIPKMLFLGHVSMQQDHRRDSLYDICIQIINLAVVSSITAAQACTADKHHHRQLGVICTF